jgi:circadian clock protein KaiB
MKLQLLLGLSEAPHFLIPGYTATVDRYFDNQSNTINTLAEVYPSVSRYQPLLNVMFNLGDFEWQTVPWQEQLSNPMIFESYRHQFPQLWEYHNLIVHCHLNTKQVKTSLSGLSESKFTSSLYVFYLFISKHNQDNNRTLKNIYNLLETHQEFSYNLKIIDIQENPELVEKYQISAIPTLVRVSPTPVKRIVGNLEDVSKVLSIIYN